MRSNAFSLPLAMVIAIVLAASVALAATSSPAGEFTVDSSLYLGRSGFSDNVTLSRGTATASDVTIDSVDLESKYNENSLSSVDPSPSSASLNTVFNSTEINVDASSEVDDEDPGYYEGYMLFHNGTESYSMKVSLDIPLDVTDPEIFNANFSENATQKYYFNASKLSGATGFYFYVNDTSATITLKQSSTTVATGTGSLTYFDYDGGLSGEYTVTVSSTDYRYISYWLIPFKLSSVASTSSNGNGVANSMSETFNTSSTRNISFFLNDTAGINYDVNCTGSSADLKKSTAKIPFVHNLGLGVSHELTSETVQVQYSMDPTNASQQGEYTGWLAFNLISDDIAVVVPINVTLKVNVTNQLNVTIVSITDLADGDAILNDTSARMDVRVDVKYLNGTTVEDISTTANLFTASMKTYYTESGTSKSKTRSATVSSVISNPTPYRLNVSVANGEYGGTFTVFVTATDAKGNTGQGNKTPIYINNSFFVINAEAVDCTGDANCNEDSVTDGNVNDKFYVDVNVKNYGYLNATSVKLALTTESCLSLLSDGEWENDNTVNLGSIAAGAEISTEGAWRFKLAKSGDCDLLIEGDSHNTSTWANDIGISVEVTGSTDENNGGGSDTTQGELSIYTFPASTSVSAGSSKTIQVKVRNTLPVNLNNVKLYVDYIDPEWYTGPYIKNIAKGEIAIYDVTFNIPADADVKNYSIKFVANTTAVSDRESAVLTVAGFGTGVSPDVALDGYNTRYDVLDDLYNEALDQGKDVEDIGTTLTNVKVLIDQANAFMDQGKTSDAEKLYDQIEDLLAQAEDSLGSIQVQKLGQLASDSFWPVAILAALVFAGLIYVARKPTSGYTHGSGYAYVPEHRRGKSILDRIKEKFDRMKKFNAI